VVAATIAAEVGADEVVIFARHGSERAVEAVTPGTVLAPGEVLALSNYPTFEAVLANRDSIQTLRTHGAADLGLLALLEHSGHGSTLVTPIMLGREAVGLLQCFTSAERHWSHSESSRARIIAQQLGPVLASLGREPEPDRIAATLSEPAGSEPAPTT
jgi:hypothetical protein